MTLTDGKPFALLSTAAALPAFLLTFLQMVLVMSWNEREARGAFKETDR